MKSLLLASAAVALTAASAHAQFYQPQSGNFHLGAGYQAVDTDEVTFDTLTLRAGYDVNPYLGFEGDLLVGLGDEDVTFAGDVFETSLDYGLGGYVKGQLPISEQFSLFARGGYTYAEVEGSAFGVTASDDVDGWAYGVGAEWAFAGPNAVRADYTRYDFEDGGEADGFGVSYVRRF